MIDAIPRYVFTIPRQTFPVPSPKINNFSRVHIANSHKLSPQPGKWPFLCDSFQSLAKMRILTFWNLNSKGRSIHQLDSSPACWHTIGARSTLHTLGLAATILSRPWRAWPRFPKSMELCRLGKKKNDVNCKPIIFLQKNNPSDCVFFFISIFPRHSLRKPPTVQWYLCRKKRTFRDCKVGSLRQCLVPQWEILWGGILLSFPVLFFMSNWRKRETMRKPQQSQSKILERRSHLLPPSRNQGNECIP